MSRSVWAAPLAVAVDGLRIGIRAQDERHQTWLRGLLSEHVVDDPNVTPNYSIRVSDDRRALHLLYWGGCLVARCRTEPELIAAIAAHLGGHGDPENGTVRFDGVAIRRGADAVILTHVDQSFAAKLVGRLRRFGVTAECRPWLDVRDGILLTSPRLDLKGQTDPASPAAVRALLVPKALADAHPPDRLLLLAHGRGLQVTPGSAKEAMRLISNLRTESVQSYADERVAERVQDILVNG